MSVRDTIKVFRELEPEDFRVLSAIELNMSKYETVPTEKISRFSGIVGDNLQYRLRRLRKPKLIRRKKTHTEGFILNFPGYDCLALNMLVKRGILDAFGPSLGVGKESDVYSALSPSQETLAVKLHRLGRTSFRQTRRARGYVADRRHISWLYQSRLAAEQEFKALQSIFPRLKVVPQPIAQNRHAVVMGLFNGGQLSDVPDLTAPEVLLHQILDTTRKIYLDLGIVHADLSEYNVLISDDESFLIIDWPQYVTRDHPESQTLIERDIRTICKFFLRKFSVKVDPDNQLTLLTNEDT
jgi:RIO kinase 2